MESKPSGYVWMHEGERLELGEKDGPCPEQVPRVA